MAENTTNKGIKEGINKTDKEVTLKPDNIKVSGIEIDWTTNQGRCTFENLPVAMMWVDTTLAGLMSGVQTMVGTERFGLALQSEGRKSVEEDWNVISQFPDFQDGFKAIANIAAVAGWGEWKLISLNEKKKQCAFRIINSWEGLYQKTLGVNWGSGMLAGKMAGYCSKLFKTNCWAEQTRFIAKGDEFDEFVVKPSDRSLENEIEKLLLTDKATKADMAVALQKLHKEILERKKTEEALKYRLKIEALVSTISTSFINVSSESIDDSINLSLQRIGEFCDVDRCYVFIFYKDGLYMDNTHEWCKHDIEPQIGNLKALPSDLFPWGLERLRCGEHVYIPSVNALPSEAEAEKEMLQSQDIQSIITVPMESENNLIGFLGFDSVTKEKLWSEEDILLLETIGNIFASALNRVQAEEGLRKSEDKHRTLFNTMGQGVVYQDKEGKITSANPSAEKILGLSIDQMQGRTSIDPRWKSIHEDGTDFPGDTHPAMVALRTHKKVKDAIMGISTSKEEVRWINIDAVPQFRKGEDKPYQVYTIFNNITGRKKSEELLKRTYNELEIRVKERTRELSKTNETLKALLDQREIEKRAIEQTMVTNLKRFVFPYLDDIERHKAGKELRSYLNIIRNNIENLISPVSKSLSWAYLNLTPTEIKVIDLIRQSQSSKEIAITLNISLSTVEKHRNKIRKKLNLNKRKVNLKTYLDSLT